MNEEISSRNFSARELRCKCGECKGNVPHEITTEALMALQAVREVWGKPMRLTSAYRCENHPSEREKLTVGRHRQGIAFDIAIPWGKDRMELLALAMRVGFKGFGFGTSFLHLDLREGAATSWGYS